MEYPPQNLLAWQVSMTLLQLLAMGMTIFRLIHRWRSHKLWWDDYLVCFPLILDGILVVALWTKFHPGTEAVMLDLATDAFWLRGFIYNNILWSSRVSLAFSLVRIFPPGQRTWKYALGLTTGLIGTYVVCLILVITCWGHTPIRCKHMEGWGIAILTLDLLSDILLIASPVYMLWHVKLPRPQRKIILCLFSSSSLSLLATVVVFVGWRANIRPGPDYKFIRVMIGHIEAGVSLIACNLLVVVMACYTALRARRPEQSTTSSQSYSDSKGTVRQEPRRELSATAGQLTSQFPQTALTVIYDDEFEPSFHSQRNSSINKLSGISKPWCR